ncbi:MAG: sulfotransferase family protein [Gammaproteobacteria bacterium]|nr:MAG: sulfotransferase family protein [Gammaproteobacteria bacterium]
MGQPARQLNGASPQDRVTQLLINAQAALDGGDRQEAARCLQQVLTLEAENVGALKGLINLALQADMKNTALQYAVRLLQVAGDSADAYEIVGAVFLELGRHEAAGAALREAMRLDPDRQSVLDNYCLVLQAEGKDEERVVFLEALLAVKKTSPRLWYAYSESRHFERGAPEVAQIRRLLKKPGLKVETRAQLQFALGKMLADGEDYDAAFRAFEAGNRLKCEAERKSVEAWRAGYWRDRAAAIAGFFDAERLAEWSSAGVARRGLTLLVGPPRAGKSLLEGGLAAHPALAAYAERTVVDELLKRHGALEGYPDVLESLQSDALVALGVRLDAAWGERPEQGIVSHLITTPGNIFYAGLILSLEPTSRLVLCRRDPFQNALAIFMKWFAKSHPYAWAVDTIAEHIAICDALGDHWQRRFPDRVTVADYDAILADPDATVRRLLAWHGLEWDAACANDRAVAAQPGVVGLAGSGAQRSAVDPSFARISEIYGDQRQAFESEYVAACQRVEQSWEAAGLSPPRQLCRA